MHQPCVLVCPSRPDSVRKPWFKPHGDPMSVFQRQTAKKRKTNKQTNPIGVHVFESPVPLLPSVPQTLAREDAHFLLIVWIMVTRRSKSPIPEPESRRTLESSLGCCVEEKNVDVSSMDSFNSVSSTSERCCFVFSFGKRTNQGCNSHFSVHQSKAPKRKKMSRNSS